MIAPLGSEAERGEGEKVPRRRYSYEEVEAHMVAQITDALYPVLIPLEQQDVAIQARNHERITALSRIVWRAFRNG